MYSFSHNEDWLIVHADGYVNGSPGAFKKVQWKEGGTTYPFEKYKSTYHRPDLIAKALGRKGKPPVRIKPVRKGKQYALLIGVSKYDPNQLYDLPFAANDVSKLAETLINKATFRKDRVILMTYDAGSKNRLRSPTARNIRRQLKGLVQLCEKDDTILIAFAGHGIQFAGETKNYFCPTDADLSDRKTLIDLEKEVYSALDKRCKARVKLLFVDACRNDPRTRQARSRREIDLRKLNQPQTVTLPRGMAAFFSCKAGQQAFEHKDLKHGVFFHFLIEGLSGKAANRTGQVTLGGLKEYVRDEVKTYAFSKFSEVQIPELRENSTDTIVLIEK